MNRDIKFRGYSEKHKCFVYGFFQKVEAQGIWYSYIFWQGNATPVRADSVAQFTGCFDKNGTEIYEGDQLHICAGYSSVVEFQDAMFVSVYTHPEDGEIIPLLDAIGKDTVVIGDVF